MTSLLNFSTGKPLPQLAERYAEALFDLACERSQLPMVEADLSGLKSMLKESAELARLIASPLLRREAISKALETLFEQTKFAGLTRQFFQAVTLNGRAKDIPVILDAFFARLAVSRGQIVADVVTAKPLTNEQAEAIKAALKDALAAHGVKEVALNTKQDTALLGGLSVRVGTWMYDGSLKGKLQEMKRSLR